MSEILLALAKGLLSGLASKIFTSIFSGKSPEEYFQEMIKEIKHIIHVAEVSNDITMIQGTLDGVISQMTIDYVNKKKSGASREQLNAFLAPIEATLNDDIMGPLQALTDGNESKGNAQQSLLVFVVGAGMQFSVLQEMAKTDPNESDPSKSQYAQDVIDFAKKYADRATTLLAKIKKSRFDDIGPVMCMGSPVGAFKQGDEQILTEDPITSLGWPTGIRDYTFAVKDKWVDKTVVSNTSEGSIWYPCSKDLDAYGKSIHERKTYVEKAKTTFTDNWDPTQKNINAWKSLESNPVPTNG